MAIKIQGSTIIDDSRKVINASHVGIGTTNPTAELDVDGNANISGIVTAGEFKELYNGQYWSVVTQADVGYGASQVPLNQYLGQLAFLDDHHPNGLRRDGASSDDVFVNSSGYVGIGSAQPIVKLDVDGDARITGILTVGSSSISIDGTNNELKVGTGVTIHHTNGVSVGNNTVHSSGLIGSNLNIASSGISTLGTVKISSGIITAVSGVVTYHGDGSNLTGITATTLGAIGGLTVKDENGSTVGTAGSISSLSFQGSSGVTVTGTTGAAGIATVLIEGGGDADTLGGISSTSFLRSDAADIKTSGSLKFNNSVQAEFGNNSDFHITHNGASTQLIHSGTGDVYIEQQQNGKDIIIKSDDGSGGVANYIVCDGSEGAVNLYHYGTQKLATKSNGIDVTGHTETDTLNVSGISTFQNSVTISGAGNTSTITGPSNLVLDPAAVGDATGTVTIFGNLQVDGTQTIINSTTLEVDDKLVSIAKSATNATQANGAGLEINGANATFTYASTGDKWVANKLIEAPGINVTGMLTATSYDIELNDLSDVTTSSTSLLLGDSVSTNSTENTVIGQEAGANINARKNTFVGYQAGKFIGNEENVAIGNQALGGATGSVQSTVKRNVAIGDRALAQIENDAINNTVVGTWAGYESTTGEYNALLGYSAGYAVTTGSNNVLLGSRAGESITSGNNNICIGYLTDASSATVSNEITLGNSSITKFRIPGLNLVHNSTGIGIGSTQPTAKVDVQGDVHISKAATNTNPHLRLFAEDSNGSFIIAEHASDHPDLEFKTAAGGSTLSLFRGAAQNTVGSETLDGIGLEDFKSIIFGTGNDAYMRYDPTPGVLDINTVVSEPITFGTNNVERLRISSGGNIGIGSTQPTAKLDVDGTLNVSGITTISEKLRVKGGDLFVQDNLTGVEQISHRAFYNNSYYANDVAKFVHQGGHPQVAVFGNYFNNSTMGAELSIVRSYSGTTGVDGAVSTAGAPIGGIKFGASISNAMVQAGFFGAFLSESGTFSDTSKPTDFRFYTNPNGAIVPTEKVRITSEGNVGIGSTIPTSKLDVVGDAKVTGISTLGTVKISSGIVTAVSGVVTYYGDGSQLTGISAGGSSPWITTGYTGIGTTSAVGIGTRIEILPYDTQNNGTLSFEGSAGQLFSITNDLTTGSIFSVNDVSGIPSIDVDADGTIQLAPFGATEFVGIGTTNPTAKLDVDGTVALGSSVYDTNGTFGGNGQVLSNVTGFGVSWTTVSSGGGSVWSTSGNDTYYTTGNVGINSTSPTAKLDVNGTSKFLDGITVDMPGTNPAIAFKLSGSNSKGDISIDSSVVKLTSKATNDLLLGCNNQGGNSGDVVIGSGVGGSYSAGYARMAVFTGSGTAELYYNDSKRLETTNTGIGVSGNFEKYDTLVGSGSTTVVQFAVTVAAKSDHRYTGGVNGASTSGYYLDGIESPFLTFTPGRTYRFDQSDSSNGSHPLRFYLDAAKTTEYTYGVTISGTHGNANAYVEIEVTDETPTILHYQCGAHAYMGNAIQTNGSTIVNGRYDVSPNNTVPVNSLSAIGTETNIDVALVPKGSGAILADIPDGATAGGNKRGSLAVDLQMSRLGPGAVASGNYSALIGGRHNTASGSNSFIGGSYASTVSGTYSAGFGNHITVSGDESYAFGTHSLADSDHSIVLGGMYASTRTIKGLVVIPACGNPQATDQNGRALCQKSILNLYAQTADANSKVLISNNDAGTGAANTTNQLTLKNNSAITFKATCVAGVTGAGNTKVWELRGALKRGANAASTALVGSVIKDVIAYDSGAAAWDLEITADTTNGAIKVEVTGQAATTIRWVCTIEATEMSF